MIRCESLFKSFGSQPVLAGLSFELRAGCHLVLAGPSGCGKTTLLRILAGLDEPDQGSVWLDGELANTDRSLLPPHARGIGFAFQTPALWPHMTVAQHLAFASHRKAPTPAARTELVEGLGIADLLHKLPHQLSGGQARRVALARAMSACPARLFLDEAFSHIDDSSKDALITFVLEHARRTNASIVLVTHDQDEARRFAGDTLQLPMRGQPP